MAPPAAAVVTPATVSAALCLLLLLLAATSRVHCQAQTPPAAAHSRSLTSQSSSSSALSATQQNLLNRMNHYRSRHGAAPLRWSKKLQDSADQWAQKCVFKHSYSGVGENLAWNYGSWAAAVDAWYNEEKQYDYNKAQWSTSIGHFTQIVWKGTKSVGCAYSCQIYVCQFEPPGNVIGYFAQNVGRKKKG